MNLLGRTQMVSDLDYGEAIRVFGGIGYDGAEVSVLNREFQVRQEIFEQHTLSTIQSAARQAGLQYLSVSCHIDYVNSTENFETVCRSFDVAKQLGCPFVIINGSFKRAQTVEEEHAEWQLTVEKTRELCSAAAQANMHLALEFEPGFVVGSTQQLLQLMDTVDAPQLKANLDLGHAYLCDPDPLASIKALSDRIVHCHIENMRQGFHDHLLPDEGDMILKDYIAQLKAIGFHGPMALDLYKYDYRSVSPHAVQVLKKLMTAADDTPL